MSETARKAVAESNRCTACGARAALVLLWTVLFVPGVAQAARPLEQAWEWQSAGELVWAAQVGADDSASLLVATRSGALHLLDAATGRPRLAEPLAASPGVRLATPAAAEFSDTILCYDRFALHAIGIREDPGLRWRHGHVPEEIDTFPGDPEVLAGWLAAAATDAGVVALDRDGTLMVLSSEDGAVRATHRVDPPALAEMHVHAADAVDAAVLWKHGDAVHAAFVDFAAEAPAVQQCRLDVPWPVFAVLAPEGLVCAGTGEVTIIDRDGARRRFAPNARLRAATVDVALAPAAGTATRPTGADRPGILLVGRGVRPAAYSLATGERLWPRDGAGVFGTDLETLRAAGSGYLATNAWGAFAGRLADGRVLAASHGLPHELLEAQVIGTALYALYRDAAVEGRLRLHRVPLRAAAQTEPVRTPATAATQPVASSGGAWFALAVPGNVRQVAWGRAHVALLLPDRIVVYNLP